MADESQVVRSIDWKSVFPFTLIFRSFRVAIHPSKLVLALAAIFLIFVGGWVLDSLTHSKYQAVRGELGLYESSSGTQDFLAERDARLTQTEASLTTYYTRFNLPEANRSLDDVEWMVKDAAEKKIDAIKKVYDEKKEPSDSDKAARNEGIKAAYVQADELLGELRRSHEPVGLFDTYISYNIAAMNQLVGAVLDGNWLGSSGVLRSLERIVIVAPSWAIRHHPIFFIVFFLFKLAVWAIFGGAIARIAAVHVAREEKISIRQALRFSTAKFLSFFSAPLIPLIIIIALALAIAVGGFLSVIPFVGPIVVGVGFFLLILAGFIVALVTVGYIGGSSMMYPTVAVEGSDSFDAISRSFSYLYARPWRLAFYSIIGLIYGTICYMFVRLFVFIVLSVTQYFGQMLIFTETKTGVNAFDAMWGGPSAAATLSYVPDYYALGPGQSVGAFFICLWTSIVVGLLGAFAISMYFSVSTIIYMLLRHEVDATELDDVYIDQPDEEFADTAPATASVTAPAAAAAETPAAITAPAEPAPPAEPPQEQGPAQGS